MTGVQQEGPHEFLIAFADVVGMSIGAWKDVGEMNSLGKNKLFKEKDSSIEGEVAMNVYRENAVHLWLVDSQLCLAEREMFEEKDMTRSFKEETWVIKGDKSVGMTLRMKENASKIEGNNIR